MKSFEKYLENFWKKYLENFWKNILEIFEKIFWKFLKKYFEIFRNNILKSCGIMFHLDCELKESENHHSSSFKKLWVGGGWWVHLDYNVSSAPFFLNWVFGSWIWSFWAKKSRSRAWQYSFHTKDPSYFHVCIKRKLSCDMARVLGLVDPCWQICNVWSLIGHITPLDTRTGQN